MPLKERDVTKTITDYLKAHGYRCLRLQSGVFSRPGSRGRITIGEKGLPDYVVLRADPDPAPITFFLELKGPKGKLSDVQVANHVQLRMEGFVVIVADSFDSFRAEMDRRGFK